MKGKIVRFIREVFSEISIFFFGVVYFKGEGFFIFFLVKGGWWVLEGVGTGGR